MQRVRPPRVLGAQPPMPLATSRMLSLTIAAALALLCTCHAQASTCRAPSAATRAFCARPPVDAVALDRYVGTWYQAYANANALFVSKPACVNARYTAEAGGRIGVLNCYYYAKDMRRPECVVGSARAADGPSRLKVSFGGRGEGPYIIAALLGDAAYGYSAVAVYSCSWRGGKARESWFILVRDPYRPEEKLRQLKWRLWCKGYDIQSVQFFATQQGGDCRYWSDAREYDVRLLTAGRSGGW